MFFTIALPLIMLVLFNALFGDNEVDTGAGSWPLSQFYTAGLAAFTAVSATFTNLANVVPIRRDEGVLKRWRGTPLPPWVYLAGLIGSAIVLAAVGVLITLALGVVAYDLEIEAAKVPAAVVTFLVGVSAFAAMGLAVAGLCPSASAASAVANAIILPMAFVSDDLHPPRGPTGVAGDARRRPAAEAVRRELPGRLQPVGRAAGVRLGRPGAGRRLGGRRAPSLPCARSSGSLRVAARPVAGERGRPPPIRPDDRAERGEDMEPELTEEHEALRAVVREFVVAEIEPHAEEWDRDHTFPVDTVLKMGELGLFGIPFPEPYGGGGDLTGLCVAIEELARADQSMAITLEAGVGLGANPIQKFGTAEQQERWLPDLCAGRALGGFGLTEPDAGSDAGGTRTKAVLDEGAGEWVDRRGEGLHHQLGDADHVARHGHRADRCRGRSRASSCRPARPAWRSSRRTARWAGTPRTPTA